MSQLRYSLDAGYQFTISRTCPTCGGTGWLRSDYCAQLPPDSVMSPVLNHQNATPPPAPCHQCFRGFQFRQVPEQEVFEWAVQRLEAQLKKYPQSLLQAIVDATERHVGGT
jgi:hypothetical protein